MRFHLLLARTLGLVSRRELYEELTAEELQEWEALYQIDPWGPERADLSIGILCSLLDACNRTKGQPDRPIDYMPYVRALQNNEPTQQSDEAMRKIAEQLAAAWGA